MTYTPEEMLTHSKLILNISEVLEIAKELFPDKNWKVRTKVGEFNAVQFYDFNSCFRFNITEPCKFSFSPEYDNWKDVDLEDLDTSTIKEKLIEAKESLK